MTSPAEFAEKVLTHFKRVHQELFANDPAANPRMECEVLGVAKAHDTPVLLLVAPWTLCGLAAPPDGRLPTSLRIGSRYYPALRNTVEGIGAYWSVILVPDVSSYSSQDEARTAANPLVEPFRRAVAKARMELTEVADGGRRALLKAGADIEATRSDATAFGGPADASGD